HDEGFSPIAEVGIKVKLATNLSLTGGYQFIHSIGSGDGLQNTLGQYDSHALMLGLSYSFGGTRIAAIAPDELSSNGNNSYNTSNSIPVMASTTKYNVTPNNSVVEDLEKVIVFAPTSFSFKFNDASPNSVLNIEKLAKDVSHLKFKKILVSGYADSTGNEEYNQKLSLQRAQAIANVLMGFDIPASKISVKGYGETNDFGDNQT
ncbi:OmpA family protein, partial [Shewanella sp. 10N.261.52.F9]|uniref:OmpA family protein n=1 Tax=Shewanella sp. 10N.261.52.F9 TaxID=3229684 RepID=UPI00354F9824